MEMNNYKDHEMENYSIFYKGSENEFKDNYQSFFENYNCIISDYIKTDDGLLVLFKAPENAQNNLEKIVKEKDELSLLEKHSKEKMVKQAPPQSGGPEGKA